MRMFITLASVLALGAAWSLGPAYAQDVKDKVERKTEKAAEKVERAAEKTADKAEDAKDTVKDKAVRAKDKVKDSAVRTTDKVKAKMDDMSARTAMTDARAAQQALKTNGFDPGPVDGRVGPRTKTAILDYQRKNELQMTGMLDEPTLAKLNVRTSRGTEMPSASPTSQPDPKKQNP